MYVSEKAVLGEDGWLRRWDWTESVEKNGGYVTWRVCDLKGGVVFFFWLPK
jgi:hypothetical protein